MASDANRKCVMIIAGEASGDQHGAKLVSAMRNRDGSLFFCGIGGQALQRAGVKIFIEASTLSVVGITEVFAKAPSLLKALRTAKRMLDRLRPHLLILIDFPDFNLNVAARAKKLGIPVLYYISPQIWAWRSGRVRKIGRRIDHMAVILPFEEPFYRKHHIPVTFVGHPLADAPPPAGSERIRPSSDAPVLGLLPGSRDKEIVRHLPVMLQAARRLRKRFDPLRVIVSLAPSVHRETVAHMIRLHGGREDIELAASPVRDVFERCRMVVAASGTVTLEAAIFGVPVVIIYKVSPMSFHLGRALIRVRHIGLANLIAGEEIFPELLQNDATPETIADTVNDMLGDADRLQNIRRRMSDVRKRLGRPGASDRVAGIALGMMHADRQGGWDR